MAKRKKKTKAESKAPEDQTESGNVAVSAEDAQAADEPEVDPEADSEAEGEPEEPNESKGSEEQAASADADGEQADGSDAQGEEPGEGEGESDDSKGDEEPKAAAPPKTGPGDKLSDEEIQRSVAALLFASHEPLSFGRLTKLLENPKPARVRKALEDLGQVLSEASLPMEPREVAGGWQLFTVPDQAQVVSRLAKVRREEKVSPAALETLAVVAYRQPVSKAEIEAIRGVQSGPMLRSLVDRGLVRVTGRAEVPGQPLLYGTTKRFLESFGLAGLGDLPRDGELVRD